MYDTVHSNMSGIFISHTHGDHAVADALTALVQTLFGAHVGVSYSTKKELDGGRGIAPGEDWFRWIIDQVRDTDVAFILLTPASIQKPWVIWEAGAVAGAAFATPKQVEDGKDEHARVVPIMFGVHSTDLPDVFARTQLLSGTDESDMMKLTDDLLGRFGDKLTRTEVKTFGARQAAAVTEYLAQVREVLLTLPHVVTEASIQEWLERLDEMKSNGRYSEAVVLENWLDVAFGRDNQDQQRPLDVRIHRRLGELYAAASEPERAARQFELARRLVPRDIFILRRLGKAYLDKKDLDAARTLMKRIEELDPTAFERNVENAALKARICRQSDDLAGARNVLETAFNNNPTSYYLGDLLGQTLVALGNVVQAKEVYARVQRIFRDVREQNVWTLATALTAAIVCEDNDAIERALQGLRAKKPTRGELQSIERGAADVIKQLGRGDDILDDLRSMEG